MSEYNTVLSTLTAVLHDKSSAKELTEVEMLLVLMERYGADSDPYKAYLLLCGYSVIGGAGDSISAALLQKAHRRLLKYSSIGRRLPPEKKSRVYPGSRQGSGVYQ